MTSIQLRARMVLAAALLAAACHGKAASPDGREIPHVAAALAGEAPSLDDAAGATYFGGLGRRLTLANGEWQGPEGQHVTLLRDFYATADINGDGAMNAVVILSATNAGPETGYYVAALRNDQMQTITLGSVRIGNPVKVRSLKVEGNQIVVEVLRRGPADQECCPSEPAVLRYHYQDNGLVLITS